MVVVVCLHNSCAMELQEDLNPSAMSYKHSTLPAADLLWCPQQQVHSVVGGVPLGAV